MHFNGPGGPRGVGHQRDQLRNALFTSFQSVPSSAKKLEHWLFLRSWNSFLPWRTEKHTHIKFYSDSSSFAWEVSCVRGPLKSASATTGIATADIATKETLVLYNVLQSFADKVQNSWVDAYVDNQALLHSWNRQGSQSQPLTAALKLLFEATLRLFIDLNVYFIPSSGNPADAPSRRFNLQDSKLSPTLWCSVQNLYGGHKGHSVDLIAHASNV